MDLIDEGLAKAYFAMQKAYVSCADPRKGSLWLRLELERITHHMGR